MVSIATVGPQGSQAWQAAKRYLEEATIEIHPRIADVIVAFEQGRSDFAVVPIYNTREGEIKDISTLSKLQKGYWIDNVVLPIELSLGALDEKTELTVLTGTTAILKQCEEFITLHYPNATLMVVQNLEESILQIKENNLTNHGIVETENILKASGLSIRQREVVPHNRTRFAVIGREKAAPTSYDATALFTIPMKDRVGLLYDILGEFSQRGINIIDLHSENDVKTQKLQIYLEAEGHIDDPGIKQVLERLEKQIIQETNSIRVLGSYPRVEMRTKHIKSFGFIGTGAMSKWFTDKLQSEGYSTETCGRTTKLRPEQMIKQVDVVAICVPISATSPAIREYGPLLKEGQGLILLAGEAEDTINTALECTAHGVEIMLVHNLWGPQVSNMKNKNAAVVRTNRSGTLCSEFEAFLHKHGADIFQDSPAKHDLLMGVSQKLPTAISVAMAMALKDNNISTEDIASHTTLTSLYSILAMARMHAQNPRTYAEIMAAKGDGNKIVSNFHENLLKVIKQAEDGDIQGLCDTIETSREYLSEDFLKSRMEQALSVDQSLGKMLQRY